MKKSLLKIVSIVFLFLVLLSPLTILAECDPITGECPVINTTNTGLLGVLITIQNLLNATIPVLIALGVVYFVYGVVTYVVASDEEAKKSGKNRIIYGIIGLAVIIGLWGFVYIITNTFNLNNKAPTNTELQRLLPQSQ